MHRGPGDVIRGRVGGGVAVQGLCLDVGGGEQVVALRSRSIIQTGGVSLSLFLFTPQRLLSLFSLPSLHFMQLINTQLYTNVLMFRKCRFIAKLLNLTVKSDRFGFLVKQKEEKGLSQSHTRGISIITATMQWKKIKITFLKTKEGNKIK